MPIDEKIQTVWNQQISDRFSGILRCGIPTGLCLQEFMMVGERPDALRPTVIISCGDIEIKKSVVKIFKQQLWLLELLKANNIAFIALVAKTDLSAGPAFDDKSMLASSDSYAVQVEESELTTSCGLKLLISGADNRVQQNCTLGGLLMVDGKILGLTAGHPFRKTEQYPVDRDSSGGDQVANSPDEERSSVGSNEPFVFNGNDDNISNDDKTTSTLFLPKHMEEWPIEGDKSPYKLQGRSDPCVPSTMWHVPHSAILPDSCPGQVSRVEDHPHDYDWQLLSSLSAAVKSRPNKVAHVDLCHNVLIEETVSSPASGEVIINIATSPPQLGFLHSSPAKLQIDKSVLDVQLITLEHVLRKFPSPLHGELLILMVSFCLKLSAVPALGSFLERLNCAAILLLSARTSHGPIWLPLNPS